MPTAAPDRTLVAELTALPGLTVHPAAGGRVAFTVAGFAARTLAERLADLDVCEAGVVAVPVAARARGWPAEAVTVPAAADGRLVAAAVAWALADLADQTGAPSAPPGTGAAGVQR